ncbi:DUF4386 domain-containing protein [Aliiroseovarius sp. KMU-50]|uniref:DUF4386 domain-containing protein n=1 Tax=Aliiroseovarius salicola TaxID=3009082 RepID=A0ABT4W0K2_9RHOB|nr:DUF4386 domain-containing protein [Aliiroseovarius sp. KMU-50]MDA5094042.1 DUF4386 domain-containing protein [Aliiroseovarius sp. KMU-50]
MPVQPTFRTHAIFAGIFFIIATAFLFVGEAFYKPGLTPPDVMAKAVAAKAQIRLGILIEFSCVLAIPLIAITLYPVLRLVSPMLAVGYVGFRVFEAALFANMEIDRMFVLALSETLAAHPSVSPETLEVLAQSLIGGAAWSGTSGPIYNLVFVIGMLMLNWMLWDSRLVPRWIAGWGLISAMVLGSIAVTVFFTSIPDTLAIALIAPLAIQEMVLALWFIFKGFDQTALARALNA